MLGVGFQQRMERQDDENYERAPREEGIQRKKRMNNGLFQDYGDDFDDYVLKRKRKLFSVTPETENMLKNTFDASPHEGDPQPQSETQKPAEPQQSLPTKTSKHPPLQDQNQAEMKLQNSAKKVEQIKPKGKVKIARRQKLKSVKTTLRPVQTNLTMLVEKEQPVAKGRSAVLSQQLHSKRRHVQRSHKMKNDQIQRLKDVQPQPLERNASMTKKNIVAQQRRYVTRAMEPQPAITRQFTTSQPPLVRHNQRVTVSRKSLREREIQMNMPLQHDIDNIVHRGKIIARDKRVKKWPDYRGKENQLGEEDELHHRVEKSVNREGDRDTWRPAGDTEDDIDDDQGDDVSPVPVFDTEVNWSQTFQISHLDLQTERSDWIDLHCNVSGNLLLHSSDAQPMVNSFMEKLNSKHNE